MPAFSAHHPSTGSLTTIRENLCIGFVLTASGFVAAAAGAEFPFVAMLFAWGLVVIAYAVKGHMDILDGQRRAELYESGV